MARHRFTHRIFGAFAWLMTALSAGATYAADALPLEQIKLPPGFSITVLARVENARQMTLGKVGPDGATLFVGSMRAGRVSALSLNGRFEWRSTHVLAEGLQLPVGVAYKDGDLFISEVSRILRLPAVERQLDKPPAPVMVTDKLPRETHHGWKFIAFGPDGKLYVPVGAPCNICEPDASATRCSPA